MGTLEKAFKLPDKQGHDEGCGRSGGLPEIEATEPAETQKAIPAIQADKGWHRNIHHRNQEAAEEPRHTAVPRMYEPSGDPNLRDGWWVKVLLGTGMALASAASLAMVPIEHADCGKGCMVRVML